MKTILFLLVSVTCCFAQPNYKGRIIEYLDKDWKTTTDPSKASYFRTVENLENKFLVRDYFMSGAIQMESECREYTPKLVQDGKTLWYYESGQLNGERFFKNNKETGTTRTFYKNGQTKLVSKHDDGHVRYEHFYMIDGTDMLVNGTGIFPDTSGTSKEPTYMDIINREPFGSYRIYSADTTYLVTEKRIDYAGGFTQLGKDISARMKYPTSARRSGHQGVVYILITVTKDGKLADTEIVKGFHPDCDAEALRVAKTLGSWIPAMHRNKKVTSRMVLPLNFKLTR